MMLANNDVIAFQEKIDVCEFIYTQLNLLQAGEPTCACLQVTGTRPQQRRMGVKIKRFSFNNYFSYNREERFIKGKNLVP